MLFAIISDIHSNYLALEEVLKDIKRQKPDKIVCLGDIVGYGAQPNECVETINEYNIDFVHGNHEINLFDELFFLRCNDMAKRSVIWTKYVLKKKNLNILKKRRKKTKLIDLLRNESEFDIKRTYIKKHNKTAFVHASLPNPQDFKYIIGNKKRNKSISISPKTCFKEMDHYINKLFIGHTHNAEYFIYRDKFNIKLGEYKIAEKVYLNKKNRYIINVGSVGQPRDRDLRASYVLFDSNKQYIKYMRIDYNYKKAYDLIIKEGLPKYLGQRLLLAI